MYDNRKPSSLQVPEKSKLSFKNNFRIEFEFRIREKDPFGYIMSTNHGDDGNGLILSYINFRNPDTSYIELSFTQNPAILTIPFPNSMIGRNNKHSLFFEYKEKMAYLTLNDSMSVSTQIDLSNMDPFQLSFGKIQKRTEPPRLDIFNIKVKIGEDDIHYWPLNEQKGNIVFDQISHSDGIFKSGELLSGRHKFIKIVKSINGQTDSSGSYFIDQDDLNLFYLIQDSLFQYDIDTWDIININSSDRIPYKYSLIYDDVQNNLFISHGGGGLPIPRYNWKTGKFSDLDRSLKPNGQYFESKKIYVPEMDAVYSFGGYGFYTYKNDILKYSFSDKTWIKLHPKLRDDEIFFPRAIQELILDKNKNKIYIVGGHGNKTGKQEAGVEDYTDIWSYDVGTDSLNLLRENERNGVLGNFVVAWQTSNNAYELVRKRIDTTYTYYLNVFDFPDGEKIVFPLNFDDYLDLSQSHFVQMDLIERTSELLFSAKGSLIGNPIQGGIHFFTLALPLAEYNDPIKSGDGKYYKLLILAGMGFLTFWLLSNKKKKPKKPTQEDDETNVSFNILEKGVTVQLFGVFRMWIDGTEIFKKDWQSKKSRELFIYLILNNQYGVTGEKLSLVFWPNISPDSAKNSRSTSLSKMRKVLGKYSKHIFIKDGRYFVLNGDTFLSDYYIVHNWLKNKDINYEYFIKVFGPHGLLSENHGEWVDVFKTDYNQKFIDRLKYICAHHKESGLWDLIEELGAFMLKWSPWDDEILSIYIQALKKTGKPSFANQVYLNFIKNYEKDFNEPYRIKFKDL